MIHTNKLLEQNDQISIQEPGDVDGMRLLMEEEPNPNIPDIDEQKDTQPNLGPLKEFGPYVTSYVSLLVPRFEEHLLIGDLPDQLYEWMKDICVSFNWQLQFINIRPECLHWIMAVSITTYPTQFMKKVCIESSRRIFDDFPRFKQKNMSNDFWAPWYFVNVGQAPYSQDAIQTFIQQIRMQQGIQ